MTEMTKEAINAKMKELVDKFNSALKEAQDFADEHNTWFSIYPEYGMGGSYSGEDGQWRPSSDEDC